MPNRYDPETDAEIVFQIFWGLVRAAISYVIFFVLDLFVICAIILSHFEAILPPDVASSIGDGSLRVVPIVGAILGACLVNRRHRARVGLVIAGVVLGSIAGNLAIGMTPELLQEIMPGHSRLVIFPLGMSAGGWLGNFYFTNNNPRTEGDEEGFDPSTLPLWDRELDG